ncbi:MAG: zf-HC2 domain-containing protein [Elusimicrobiales bacterium]|nr:zf-HC2 domain-containing protein [Elusimicrobiales bacterium]
MEHNTCRENLSSFLDGELPREEKLSLESHLAACPGCRRELAELKRVSAVFRKHAMEPAPLSLKEAVFAEKPSAPFFSSWLKPAAAFAAAAAGLLIILALPKTGERKQQASPEVFQAASPASIESLPAAYKEEAFQSPSADDGADAKEASSFSAGSLASGGGGGSGQRYAAPAAARGAYGQAKFAGSLRSKEAVKASASSVPLTGDPALAAFFAEGNMAKRAAPKTIPDIVADGVRFSASHWRETGRLRNGGSIKAFDARTSELLWETRVYEVPEDPNLEADVQQVHISSLALKGGFLEISDERGSRYSLDTRTRKAETLPR